MKNRNNQTRLILAVAMCTFGCALLTAALIIRPTGEIHSSVLAAYATTLTYSAALFGINFKEKKTEGDEH